MVKTDSEGDTMWCKTIGDEYAGELGRFVSQSSDGGFIICGSTTRPPLVFNDLLIVKTDSLGNQLWWIIWGGLTGDSGSEIQQTSDGGYIVTGVKDENIFQGLGDIFLIKLEKEITKVKETKNVNRYELNQNYPNPFNPVTKISYQIPELSFVKIKVYDVLGSEIATLVNEEKPAGNYEVEFNGVGLPSGIYFYQIQAGDYIETKKMVLMK